MKDAAYTTGLGSSVGSGSGNGKHSKDSSSSGKSKKKNEAKNDPYSWVDNLESLQSLHTSSKKNGSGNGQQQNGPKGNLTSTDFYGNSGYEIIAEMTNDGSSNKSMNGSSSSYGIVRDINAMDGEDCGFLDVGFHDYEPTEKRRRDKKKKNKG